MEREGKYSTYLKNPRNTRNNISVYSMKSGRILLDCDIMVRV